MAFFNNLNGFDSAVPMIEGSRYYGDIGIANIIEETAADQMEIMKIMFKHDLIEMKQSCEVRLCESAYGSSYEVNELEVAKEGAIKDFFKKIIEAIKNFFAKVFAFFKNLIQRLGNSKKKKMSFWNSIGSRIDAYNKSGVRESYGFVTEAISVPNIKKPVEIEGYEFNNEIIDEMASGRDGDDSSDVLYEFINELNSLMAHVKKASDMWTGNRRTKELDERLDKEIETVRGILRDMSGEDSEIYMQVSDIRKYTDTLELGEQKTIKYDKSKLSKHIDICAKLAAADFARTSQELLNDSTKVYNSALAHIKTCEKMFNSARIDGKEPAPGSKDATLASLLTQVCSKTTTVVQDIVGTGLRCTQKGITYINAFDAQTKRAVIAALSQ